MEHPSRGKQIVIIAAAAENDVLGKDNDLIWHIPHDLKRFKRLTLGHAVIMGRKTFESMPKALPKRQNIVITRKKDYHAENALVCHSMAEALSIAQDDDTPFIIGGGEIYREGMNWANRIELTRVHQTFEGDTYFPKIDPKVWEIIAQENHPISTENKIAFSYITYHKKQQHI